MCVVRLIKNLEILLMVSILQFVTGTRTLHLIYDLFVLSDLLNLDCFPCYTNVFSWFMFEYPVDLALIILMHEQCFDD